MRIAWPLAVALGLVACGSDQKSEQCSKMKAAVVAAAEQVLAAPRVEGGPEGIAQTANAQADAMLAARATLLAAQIQDPTLDGYRRQLVAIAEKKVLVLRRMAAAGSIDDPDSYQRATREADELNAEEDAISVELAARCGR